MALPKQRGEERSTSRRRPPAGGQTRRRSCHFCRERVEEIDYKNLGQLRRHVSERGRIRARQTTGACRRHQVQLGAAVKRARVMALLPYASSD